ncbi:DUF4253 domain-containing protein [Streptomyces sp. NBC_00829]|uniref:DUF4253 domain-containing protein n=1 Tax=Streptomyces sp. NBC_00829 TaxID=2903679 RepID=UPI00386C4789
MFDQLVVSVAAPPHTQTEAEAVAAEHLAFCPDNLTQGPHTALREYATHAVLIHGRSDGTKGRPVIPGGSAHGGRCGASQGGGSSSYGSYSDEPDNAARCRSRRQAPGGDYGTALG